MPDDAQTDPVADMLGEGSGGGALGTISRYARRVMALQNGGALEVAKMRMQEHLRQQDQMMQLITHAADQGMDIGSPGFRPLLKNLPQDVAAFLPEYAHQKKTQSEAEDQQQMQLLGLKPEDLTGASPAAGAGRGGGSLPQGTSPAVSPAASPASAGGGAPGLHYMDPKYDWAAHAQNEPPEEAALHKQMKVALFRLAQADRQGKPTAALKGQLDDLSKQYHDLLNNRLGFNKSSQIEAQRAADQQKIQDRIDARQQAGFTHADAHPKAPANAAFTLNTAYEKFGPEIDRINKISDPDEKMQAAEALNTQIDSIDAQAEKLGLPKQGNHYRQKLDVITNSGIMAKLHLASPKTVKVSPQDPLVGTSTKQKDGKYPLPKTGKVATVKGGKVVDVSDAGTP